MKMLERKLFKYIKKFIKISNLKKQHYNTKATNITIRKI